MSPENRKSKRLVALFLLGFVLLNYPVLSLFNANISLFGLPLLYVFIFGIWGLLILLSALVVGGLRNAKKNSANSEN
jgi:hypothetical protein